MIPYKKGGGGDFPTCAANFGLGFRDRQAAGFFVFHFQQFEKSRKVTIAETGENRCREVGIRTATLTVVTGAAVRMKRQMADFT